MQRFFVTESIAVTEEGEKISCYGVRSVLGTEIRDLCFEEEKERLRELVEIMNAENLDEQSAIYVIEDFCMECAIPERKRRCSS